MVHAIDDIKYVEKRRAPHWRWKKWCEDKLIHVKKKKVEVHSREDGADIEEGDKKWIVVEELDKRGYK